VATRYAPGNRISNNAVAALPPLEKERGGVGIIPVQTIDNCCG